MYNFLRKGFISGYGDIDKNLFFHKSEDKTKHHYRAITDDSGITTERIKSTQTLKIEVQNTRANKRKDTEPMQMIFRSFL